MYALGGNDGSSSLNSVEKYNLQLDKWTIVTSMETRRSSIGATVLDCFNLERGIAQNNMVRQLTTIQEKITQENAQLSSSVPNT